MARISAQGINQKIIDDFKEFVRKKYNKIHTVYGLELQNAMKIYMALQGNQKYQYDTDVKVILQVYQNQFSNKNSQHDTNKQEMMKWKN